MSCWIDSNYNTEDKREKLQALSLAKECYSMKLDLLNNATVVDDAIRFVSSKSKENQKSSPSDSNKSEFKSLRYRSKSQSFEPCALTCNCFSSAIII
jgi:hypothetical protein